MKIAQLGPTKYRLFWELGRTEDGRRQQKTRVVHCSKREAERRWREEQIRIESTRARDTGSLTVAQAAERYLAEARLTLRDETFKLYSDTIAHHIIPTLGDCVISELTTAQGRQVVASIAGQGTIRTAQIARDLLSRIYKHAETGYANPIAKVKPPTSQPKEMLYWAEDECQTFLAAIAGHPMHPLFALALASGMRISEILGLQWHDIDVARATISVRRQLNHDRSVGPPKTRRALRKIDVGANTVALLMRHKRRLEEQQEVLEYPPSPFVFLTTNGTPYLHRNVSKSLDLLIVKAGVRRIRVHDLRHTHATILLSQGVNMRVLSERLGHSSVSFTMQTYAHVLPTMQRQAADISDHSLFGDTFGDTSAASRQ